MWKLVWELNFSYQEATKAVAAVEKQRREEKEDEAGIIKTIAKSKIQTREVRPSPYRSKCLMLTTYFV